VRQIELIERQLREADGVAGVLAAGWENFELIGVLAADSAEKAADMYPAFMFARGAAVDGRNAIMLAPSMPAGGPASFGSPELSTGDVDEVADALAGLASAMSARLREAALLAVDDGDRIACENAARDADQIGELLARSA
jgi:hypothetical protein